MVWPRRWQHRSLNSHSLRRRSRCTSYPKEPAMKISNKMYDGLKFVAQIGIPAIGTLYSALAGIWTLPDAFAVVGTLTAVDAALGTLLGLSSKAYNAPTDGSLIADDSPDKTTYQLVLTTPVSDIAGKD